MNSIMLDEMLTVATKAALEAGELLRNIWAKPRQISEKGFRDLTTLPNRSL
jgi:hypothetical protein